MTATDALPSTPRSRTAGEVRAFGVALLACTAVFAVDPTGLPGVVAYAVVCLGASG